MRERYRLLLTCRIVSSIALAAPFAARAAGADCYGLPPLSDAPAIGLGHISAGAPRTFFVENGSDTKGCPDPTDRCRSRAYLVPGDRVLFGRSGTAFVCAEFINSKGRVRAGWLPAASIVEDAPAPVGLADWIGTWSMVEATMTIARAEKPGMLAINGEATWGALDPERVQRGAVHIGSIDALASPSEASLSFAMGENETLHVDMGDSFACKVWMRRLGPYLLVEDNHNCGGMNVSFTGTYTRKAAPTKRR
jgi:hypothetical protein